MKPKLIFASDYRGVALREALVSHARSSGCDVKDIGIPVGSPLDYIDISKQLAEELRSHPDAYGVISCGSGQGVAIALNRFTHLRACMCRTPNDARQVREKLNANVICLGSKYNTAEESFAMVEAFIDTNFVPDKHQSCVNKLAAGATNHHNDGINLIVRGIIIHNDHILLTTVTESNVEFEQGLYFLPGGHVDHNEPAQDAMKREILEEMGLHIDSMAFKGVLECSWDRKGKPYHEVNFVFDLKIPNLSLSSPPQSLDHGFQEFVWVPINKVSDITILPGSLKPLISKVYAGIAQVELFSDMMT